MYKNVASQKLIIYAYDNAASAPKTGDAANITCYISKDGGAAAQSNDVNPTELSAANLPGLYAFDLTQTETNCNLFAAKATSATADVDIDPVIEYTEVETVIGTASTTYTMTIVTQTAGGTRIPWVTVAIVNGSGTTIAAFNTGSSGSYSQELDAGTYTLKPYKPEYSFSNSTETVSASATITLTGTAVSQSSAQFTPQDILELVRHQSYETSPGFWSDAEIYSYMWQAETEIAQMVECTEYSDTSTTTVASTQEYTKPTDCLYIKRVLWNNVPLKCVDFRGKDFYEHGTYGSTDSEGQPHSYYEWGTVIGLYPIPEEAQTLTFYYIRQPAKLSSSSTYFTVPTLFHNAIVEYCLSRMYAKDQDEQRSSLHWQLWMQNVNTAKEKWTTRMKSNRFHVVKNSDNYPQTELGLI